MKPGDVRDGMRVVERDRPRTVYVVVGEPFDANAEARRREVTLPEWWRVRIASSDYVTHRDVEQLERAPEAQDALW